MLHINQTFSPFVFSKTPTHQQHNTETHLHTLIRKLLLTSSRQNHLYLHLDVSRNVNSYFTAQCLFVLDTWSARGGGARQLAAAARARVTMNEFQGMLAEGGALRCELRKQLKKVRVRWNPVWQCTASILPYQRTSVPGRRGACKPYNSKWCFFFSVACEW